MKKFKLTDEKIIFKGRTLYRIQALRDFGDVKAGDLGGFVEKESNLSHTGNCWIYDNAKAYDNAQVFDNAKIYDYAQIFDNAKVFGNARVYDKSWVHGNARVYDNSRVYECAKVYNNAWAYGYSHVFGFVLLCGYARVHEGAWVSDNGDYCVFQGFGSKNRSTTFYRKKDLTIGVVSGCFTGTIEEFEKQVEKTHGDNKFGRGYKAILEVVKIKFPEYEKELLD